MLAAILVSSTISLPFGPPSRLSPHLNQAVVWSIKPANMCECLRGGGELVVDIGLA